jgi:hypothetical protein
MWRRTATPAASGLSRRLQPHVRRSYDSTEDMWWSPHPTATTGWRRAGATRTRAEELAQVCGRLEVLVEAGEQFSAAVMQVACTGRGEVAAELHAVADSLGSGHPPAEAAHGWARRTGCPAVGALAADLRRATSSDEEVAALRQHADARRHVAHHWRVRSVRLRVRVLWLVAAVSVAVSVAAF